MPDAVFSHPRLARVYDPLDPDRSDLDAYVAMCVEFGAASVLDIGCGTGTLACRLAVSGLDVTAVDPAGASLDVARGKPGASLVRWVHGTAPDVLPLQVDLAFMTANVAQVFVADADWADTLRAAYEALVPGGRLVFESRDPARRAWEEWTQEKSWVLADVPGEGLVESWHEVVNADGRFVTFESPTIFHRDAERIESQSTLVFRPLDELTATVEAAGFVLDEVRDAPDRPGREFVLVCRKPSAA